MRPFCIIALFAFLATTVLGDLDLGNWMGQLKPYIGNLSMLDLSIPGSHDTLTYDLSAYESDDGYDMPTELSDLIHELQSKFPLDNLGNWVRDQSQTQALSVTQQLDNGVRYIDFRMTYSTGPGDNNQNPNEWDWYGIHMVETNNPTSTYFTEIKEWMNDHPQEVVLITLSQHGNLCKNGTDQYPGTTTEIQQQQWNDILDVFGNMVVNTAAQPLKTTSIAELTADGPRVVFYASNWEQFTNSDDRAYDACAHVDNTVLNHNLDDIPGMVSELNGIYENASKIRAQNKENDTLYLLSMAEDPPGNALKNQLYVHYLPKGKARVLERHLCSKQFDVPKLWKLFCPESLLLIEQLRNFYTQEALYNTFTDPGTYSLPGAIYIDAIADGGLIRTGSSTQYGEPGKHQEGYAYAATLLLYNVAEGCKDGQQGCDDMKAELQAMIEQNPSRKWNNRFTGRNKDWPDSTTEIIQG
eukprot:Clim_evm50s195 gene=Clim_evmTU50s195